jgi:anionic cell wall polymer biosynthesis LytR-Cps2A-Psr (LCP) family protein
LDGAQALAYIRMRKEDPEGDFGRQKRQRQLLSDAVDRITRIDSVRKLPGLLSKLSRYVRTNLTSGNMTRLALHYRPAIGQVTTERLQGAGSMMTGIYYWKLADGERERIHRRLLVQLSKPSGDDID